MSAVDVFNPVPNPYFWDQGNISAEDLIKATFLMPNGPIIDVVVPVNATIDEVKEELWEAAEKFPHFNRLKDKSMYALVSIHKNRKITTTDESKRVFELNPFLNVFKLEEKQSGNQINPIDEHINQLIGRPTQDFVKLKNPEVKEFRYRMSLKSEELAMERKKSTWIQQLQYHYPPRLVEAQNPKILEMIISRLKSNTFVFSAKFDFDQTTFTFNVSRVTTPVELMEMIITKMNRSLKVNKRSDEYILKVCGQEEYIYGDSPLIDFVYIQEMLAREAVPTAVLMSKDKVPFDEALYTDVDQSDESTYEKKERLNSMCTLKRNKKNIKLSWDVNQQFQVLINEVCNVSFNHGRADGIGITAGIYHGGKPLCQSKTAEATITNTEECRVPINQNLIFDICVKNIPRMARLCLVIYENVKTNKTSNGRMKRTNKLAWVNMTVFDYKDQLKSGTITLNAWNFAQDIQTDDMLNPLGTVETNIKTDEQTAITMKLFNYNSESSIVFPSKEKVLQYATMLEKTKDFARDSAQDTRSIKEVMGPYMTNDRTFEMHDQDRNAIWAKRDECRKYEPDGLPCLLHCVEWKDRDEVALMTLLLKEWPTLSVERSLELLDYAYADRAVRSFAVDCLKSLKDEELLLYLLQLVQAIKHENYLHCDLVDFLLVRALNNQRIGHFFFWHLRSEMHIPSVQLRFGILLEAYLRGSPQHIKVLCKQMEALTHLKSASIMAKKGSKDKAKYSVQEFFNKEYCKTALTNFLNPLNPSFYCKSLKAEKSKVMDSKMRPLWVVFDNRDRHGDDIFLIFKNGDDLRQDMLTIQMLRVMDRIWKSDGLDFRMNPYCCISLESRIGMIEVVLNAETIANIQKEKGMFSATSPFKKGSLLAWLKDHNNTEELLAKAIQEFTYSCAGYCVATYVLGVADRHSDNIMVKKSGQMFHIDFGHILGHFKEKFGFRRERVPFVLTNDFVYVITNGSDKESQEFQEFRSLCEKAFLLLRKHGCLILSLFAMMISTGLPELSSEKDLNYLRETLVLHLKESEALIHFNKKFDEALVNSWKTSLNWASHNFSKNNKQ